jgi:hypothetical protein
MSAAPSKIRISAAEWDKKMASSGISKSQMNALVMDFLVTEGYVEAARTFEKESSAKMIVSDDIEQRASVRQLVHGGRVEEAMEAVKNSMHGSDGDILKPSQASSSSSEEGKSSNQALLFHLEQQSLIEIIRGGNNNDQAALDFAQDRLSSLMANEDTPPDLLDELEKTICLLAFPHPESSILGSLLSPAHRQKTGGELNQALLESRGLPKVSRLTMLLKLLAWAQGKLDEKAIYPKLTGKGLVTGELTMPE